MLFMLTKAQVKHIAKLARLGLTEKEISKMQKELAVILDYINQLNQVDVSQAKPSFQANVICNVMRADQAEPQRRKTIEAMLSQAPDKEKDYVKVKQVL